MLKKITALLLFCITQVGIAQNYKADKTSTEEGGSSWGVLIFKMRTSIGVDGKTQFRLLKKDFSEFKTGGKMYLKEGGYSSYAKTLTSKRIKKGEKIGEFEINLNNLSNFPKQFYIRYVTDPSSQTPGYGWVGPITIKKLEEGIPAKPSFSPLPSGVKVYQNKPFTFFIKAGKDPNGKPTKISVSATNSDYSRRKYESSYNTTAKTHKVEITFNKAGKQSVFATTYNNVNKKSETTTREYTVQVSNSKPSEPVIESTINSVELNKSHLFSFKSGTSSERKRTKIIVSATNSNVDNYSSSYDYSSRSHRVSIRFNKSGEQTISVKTQDELGNFSNAVTKRVNVTSATSKPTPPLFSSVPSNFTAGEAKTISVQSGNSKTQNNVKLILWAEDSNYTISNPFTTSLTSGNTISKISMNFTKDGSKYIYAKTVDSKGLESTIVNQKVTVGTKVTTHTNVQFGKINFTANTITESSNGVFSLSGNIKANDFVHFEGQVTVDKNDMSIEGNGRIYLNNIPRLNDATLYNGAFEFNLPNTTDELKAIAIEEANNKFKLSGLDVFIGNIKFIDGGIDITGKIALPDLFGKVKVDISQIRITNTHGVQGVGELHVNEIEIRKTFTLKNLNFVFNSIKGNLTAKGGFKTNLFEADADVEIINSKLEKVGVYIELKNPKPLGTTGLSLKGAGGAVKGISTPPLSITLNTTLVPSIPKSEKIVEFSEVKLNYTLGTSLSGSGKFKIMGAESAKASFEVEAGKFIMKGQINLADFVNALIELAIVKNEKDGIDVYGRFKASVQIPKKDEKFYDWLDAIMKKVKGKGLPITLANSDMVFYNTKLKGKFFLELFSLNLRFLGLGKLDTDVKFSYLLSYENGKINADFSKGYKLFNKTVFPKIDGVSARFMKPLARRSNIGDFDRFAGQSLVLPPLQTAARSATPFKREQNMILPEEVETIVIEVSEQGTNIPPNFSIKTPDGITIDKNNVDNYGYINATENIEKGKTFYTIKNAKKGNWVITVPNANSTYLIDVFGTTLKAGIALNELKQTGNTTQISWVAHDPDYNGNISLFYSLNNEQLDGELITAGIEEDSDIKTYTWNTTGIPTGSYYVYALMYDKDGSFSYSYSPNKINIGSDVPSPTNLKLKTEGSTGVKLTWEEVKDGNEYTYLVYQQENGEVTFASQNQNVGKANEFTVKNLNTNNGYQFFVVAMDKNKKLSSPTNIEKIEFSNTQIIDLEEGWNLIGLTVKPNSTNVKEIFKNTKKYISEVKTLTQSYKPTLSDTSNSLAQINVTNGYWVKATQKARLTIRGQELPKNGSVNLQKGWNIISFLSKQPVSIITAIQSIKDQVEQVKDIKKSYTKGVPESLNTLTELRAGKGYLIKVNTNCTLKF